MDVNGQSTSPQQSHGAYDNKPLAGQYRSPYAALPVSQTSNQKAELELDATLSLLQPIYEFVGTSSPATARNVLPASGYIRSNVSQTQPSTTDSTVPTVVYSDSSLYNGGSSRVPQAFMYPDLSESNTNSSSLLQAVDYRDQSAKKSYAGSHHLQLSSPAATQYGNNEFRQTTPSTPSAIKQADIEGSAPPQARSDSAHSPASKTSPKKTRAKTGCLTCRKRKTKCDEKKPKCDRCLKRGAECIWPDPLATIKKRGPKPKTLGECEPFHLL